MKTEQETIEVYIHIPFCRRKCAYCDFLSFPAGTGEQRRYVDELLEEIRQTWIDASVATVFIGGGTPSILPAEWIAEILTELRKCFAVRTDAEITIEANPGTVDAEKLRIWREAGVNRISFGCQSMHDDELQILGRIHTAEEVRAGVALARAAGFTNINLDLMSGIPGQTPASWEATLRQAVALAPEHISAYSLTLEEGTPLYERYGGAYAASDTESGGADAHGTYSLLPDEETERQMYDRTAEILAEAGYRQYEISNYARKGCACRHNLGYWTGVPYVGFGLGAASFLPQYLAGESTPESEEECRRPAHLWRDRWVRYTNADSMLAYLGGVREHTGFQLLKQKDLEAEFMILGLRLTDGVEDAEFTRRFGYSPDLMYGRPLTKYTDMGLLIRENGRTRLSRAGISVSNTIFVDFL